ncbi:hypothetical protein [Deinococcus arcticus]|uniref:ATP-grasp domain-containing protein n=1 Tax=Deinococcus arcticus TaxID=2136176 RepID=A0A2T3W4K4_9DEIO|nr:hypothetical protein [Deinococcus arcticus]PTA66821.1 hypothetical protein C8263_15900 [Deinococcus arcticus]
MVPRLILLGAAHMKAGTRVLITGARAPVALDLARALRAVGAEVALADSVTPFAAHLLRPRVPVHRLPPPRRAFAAFRAALLRLLSTEAFDLVVPTCEEVFWLAEAARRDGWADRLLAPDPATLRALHSKALFPELARAAGVDAPQTWVLASPAQVQALHPEGLIFKPEFSRFGAVRLGGPGAAPTPARRWVAQERLVGEELCVWSVAHGGELGACVVYRPTLRHGGGASYAFEAVDRPAVEAATRALVRATGATGQLSFDLIVTPEGRVAPLECNPRATSGLHLLDRAALGRAVLGAGPVPAPTPGTLRYLAPALAVLGPVGAVQTGAIRPLLHTWRAGQDAVGCPGNRAPVAGALLDAARFALSGALAGRSAVAQSTADIEWNGEAMP